MFPFPPALISLVLAVVQFVQFKMDFFPYYLSYHYLWWITTHLLRRISIFQLQDDSLIKFVLLQKSLFEPSCTHVSYGFSESFCFLPALSILSFLPSFAEQFQPALQLPPTDKSLLESADTATWSVMPMSGIGKTFCSGLISSIGKYYQYCMFASSIPVHQPIQAIWLLVLTLLKVGFSLSQGGTLGGCLFSKTFRDDHTLNHNNKIIFFIQIKVVFITRCTLNHLKRMMYCRFYVLSCTNKMYIW